MKQDHEEKESEMILKAFNGLLVEAVDANLEGRGKDRLVQPAD